MGLKVTIWMQSPPLSLQPNLGGPPMRHAPPQCHMINFSVSSCLPGYQRPEACLRRFDSAPSTAAPAECCSQCRPDLICEM